MAQLETTLKADLNDKKTLTDILSKERESYAKLEADYKDMQSRYFKLKEAVEEKQQLTVTTELGAKDGASGGNLNADELQEALLCLRQDKVVGTKEDDVAKGGDDGEIQFRAKGPTFLETFDSQKAVVDKEAEVKAELNELQVHHVEAVNELEKTRSLLKAQGQINAELKQEVNALQSRLQQVNNEFQVQLGEYKKLLDIRAARIQKLEIQLREAAYSQVSSSSSTAAAVKGKRNAYILEEVLLPKLV